MADYDFVIVGAGSAGWFVASRHRESRHRLRELAAELADQAAPALVKVAHAVEGVVPRAPARSS